MSSRDSMLFRKKSLVRIGKIFGSGLVTGVAEDDCHLETASLTNL
jgi:hypothetical protein